MPEYAKNPVNWVIIGALAFAGIKGINFALKKFGATQYAI